MLFALFRSKLNAYGDFLNVNFCQYMACIITLTHSKLNTPTMLCKCFRGMSVYLLYTLTTIPPCNNLQSLRTNFNVFIIVLQEYIFSTQSVTDNLVLLQFQHSCSQYSFNITKLSTFNGHVSHFTSGIYDWASLYSLNYESVFPPPQALMTMLQAVKTYQSLYNSTKMNYSLYKACTRITM
jgi:hypothetical protein